MELTDLHQSNITYVLGEIQNLEDKIKDLTEQWQIKRSILGMLAGPCPQCHGLHYPHCVEYG